MNYHPTAAAMILAAALTTTSASAQGLLGNSTTPPTLGVYDAGNKFVGIPVYPGLMAIKYGKKWYWLEYGREALDFGVLFYYTSTNCTGQPWLLYYNLVPTYAYFDKETTTIWAPADFNKEQIDYKSWLWGGICYPSNAGYGYPSTIWASLPKALDTHVDFKGPFTVR